MKRELTLIASALTLVLLAGCQDEAKQTVPAQSAAPAGASGQEAQTSDPAPLADTLIELEPGMRWSYTVNGEMRAPEQPAPLPLTGSIEISIEQGELDGEPVLALQFDQNIRPDTDRMPPMPEGAPGDGQHSIFGDQAPPAAVFYFAQNPNTGAVNFIGDNNGPDGSGRKALGEGGLFIPGQWSAETAYENTIEWEGGDSTWNWLAVDGTEVIATGEGEFTAWRAPNRSSDSNGLEVEGTDWWTPQLGQPVKFESTTQLPNGGEVYVQAVLEETNVLD